MVKYTRLASLQTKLPLQNINVRLEEWLVQILLETSLHVVNAFLLKINKFRSFGHFVFDRVVFLALWRRLRLVLLLVLGRLLDGPRINIHNVFVNKALGRCWLNIRHRDLPVALLLLELILKRKGVIMVQVHVPSRFNQGPSNHHLIPYLLLLISPIYCFDLYTSLSRATSPLAVLLRLLRLPLLLQILQTCFLDQFRDAYFELSSELSVLSPSLIDLPLLLGKNLIVLCPMFWVFPLGMNMPELLFNHIALMIVKYSFHRLLAWIGVTNRRRGIIR